MTTYTRMPGTQWEKTEEIVANLDDLRELIDRGDFHHATYRDHGKCHEGLKIYARDSDGFRGYRYVGMFLGGHYATAEDKKTLAEAERIVARFGTSVGSHGNG